MTIDVERARVMGWPVATCAHCGNSIVQTQPYRDGWVHRYTGRERCDPMYVQSPNAEPRS